MPKVFSLLKFASLLICFTFLVPNISAQTDKLRDDLSKSLKKFDLINIDTSLKYDDNAVDAGKAKKLSVQAAGKNYLLNLHPRDLRSARYRAEETNAVGNFPIQVEDVNTFAGEIVGEKGSQIRLTIENGEIEGYFLSNDGKFYIEPARRFSKSADKNQSVIYRREDLLEDKTYFCENDMEEKIKLGKSIVAKQVFSPLRSFSVLEIATEADFEYVTALGGSEQANKDILSILNMVEGVYQKDLAITFEVVFQHTWKVQDPYPQTNTQEVLLSFRTYWNANYPVNQIPRDAAHLWTAKQALSGMGRAYLGVICRNVEASYSLHGRVNFSPIDELLTAHEIAHNFNATHADGTQNCEKTIMNTIVSNNTNFSFCPFSIGEIKSFVAVNDSCLAQKNLNALLDFDGDNRADLSIFRPSNGVWFIAKSSGGFDIFQFGQNGDKPVPGDYDGDGKTDAAIFRSGVWYRLRSSNGTFDAVNFGTPTDIPAPADFDGDGKADIAVFRPSTGIWYIFNSRDNSVVTAQFGAAGDVPLAADFDGDGKADINVWRPSNGVWYRINSSNGTFNIRDFGISGDKPLIGDFDGDGKADLSIFRDSNGTFYSLSSINGAFNVITFGSAGDVPVPADYDGDGETDVAVFRPSNGVWFIRNSTNGSVSANQFGIGSDIAVPSFYNQ